MSSVTISSKVNTTDNTVKILVDDLRNASLALQFMLQDIQRKADPKTPKDTGRLRQSPVRQVLGLKGIIEWKKVYAQYQERGARKDGSHRVRNYSTPGTGPHWAENAVIEVAKSAELYFKKARLI